MTDLVSTYMAGSEHLLLLELPAAAPLLMLLAWSASLATDVMTTPGDSGDIA